MVLIMVYMYIVNTMYIDGSNVKVNYINFTLF